MFTINILTLRTWFTGDSNDLDGRVIGGIMWGEHGWCGDYNVDSFHDCAPFLGRFTPED
jgi:hypothetical protein